MKQLFTGESLPTDNIESQYEHINLIMGTLYNEQISKIKKQKTLFSNSHRRKSIINEFYSKSLKYTRYRKDQAKSNWIISHKSKWKMLYDNFIAFLIGYSLITSLFYLAFGKPENMLETLDILMQCIFGLDLILKFFTDYKNNSGDTIISHKKIILRYLRFQFFRDLLCLIPFRYIWIDLEYLIRNLRFFRIERVLRLFNNLLNEIFKIIKISKIVKDLNKARFLIGCIRNLWRYLIIMCFSIYLVGCLFYWYSSFFPHNFADHYFDKETTPSSRLFHTLYFIATTLATLGFGDFIPVNLYERAFMMFIIIIGIAFYSYAMGLFISSVSEFNFMLSEPDWNSDIKAWINTIEEKYGKIPKCLRTKIIEHFINYWENDRLRDLSGKYWAAETYEEIITIDHQYLSHLPKSLIKTIFNSLFSDVFFWFKSYFGNSDFKYDLIFHFQPRFFEPEETICQKGEKAKEVLFILKGKVVCEADINGKYKTILQFDKGRTVIGDFSILTNTPVSVDYINKSKSIIQAFAVPKKAFLLILNEGYPAKKKELIYMSTTRENKIRLAISQAERKLARRHISEFATKKSDIIDIELRSRSTALARDCFEMIPIFQDEEDSLEAKTKKRLLKCEHHLKRKIRAIKRNIAEKRSLLSTMEASRLEDKESADTSQIPIFVPRYNYFNKKATKEDD